MNDNLRALDPGASVVVEACAGSGKTWTLVSRLIRLLLAGVAPGEILAITYTRKAAREIDERLQHWLGELAVSDDAWVIGFLAERGVDARSDPALIERARGLFERVARARPGLTINTFHGWFSSLLGAAPLSAGLGGMQLAERTARLRDQAWGMLMRRAGSAPDGELAQSIRWLLSQAGVSGTRSLAAALIDRRAEWQAWLAANDGLDGVFARLKAFFGADGIEPVEALAQDDQLRAAVLEFARFLGRGTEAQQRKANDLETACGQSDAQMYFAGLCAELLTKAGVPIAFKPGKSMEKIGVAERTQQLFDQCADRVLQCLHALTDGAAWVLNRHALCVASAMLDAYDRVKRGAGVLDFGDLEWQAARLLSDAQTGPFVQARLDARYRHLLLDEFQDTNPLQWQVLMHWLDAYAPDQVQPRVFVVGDPKQSIYRFRRADPRIFTHAREAFAARFGAIDIRRNETRRSSPAVVEAVNALFGSLDVFEGFAPHTTSQTTQPGAVEVLPAFGHDADGPEVAADAADGLRNPLTTSRVTAEDSRRRREAEAMCMRLKQMVGHLAVRDVHGGEARPARYGDMMILLRRRTGLAVYEAALRRHGIPYFGASRGCLLDTLEAADLQALLRFLAAPADALALAHVLRSPLFAFSDRQLLALTAGGADVLWPTLRTAAAGDDADFARAALLLSDWLAAAVQLPVHDLLDRVFHQGELMARYASVVGEMAWPGVRANLEAFIELALKVDSGRYPSLPRFLDELDRLRSEDDEAPDEGLILGEDPSRGRVRVLTVHAAKGLEAPIVWLADAIAKPRADSGVRVLLAWPPGASAPEHLSLLQRKDNQGAARAAFIDAEARAAAREDANLLYVAVTRARQFLFASGVAPARGNAAASWLERLAEAVRACAGAQATADGGCRLAFGDVDACPAGSPRVPAEAGPAVPGADPAPIGVRRPPTPMRPEQLWGTGLHAWLEALGCGEPAPARLPGLDAAQWGELESIARRLVSGDDLRRFFDPASHVRSASEIEFVLPDGSVGRIDRLVEFDDDIWVLDYKSGAGGEYEQDYAGQLLGYVEAVRLICPGKPLRAALIRPDGRLDIRL
jgi:ATP-dependent helicase/nuclease subunit A